MLFGKPKSAPIVSLAPVPRTIWMLRAGSPPMGTLFVICVWYAGAPSQAKLNDCTGSLGGNGNGAPAAVPVFTQVRPGTTTPAARSGFKPVKKALISASVE